MNNPIFRNFDYDTRATMLEKLKRKQKSRQKVAMFERFALTDPIDDVMITPIPYPPAEPAPCGMLDGIYPQEDRESKPISSLDYGILETHMADDGANVDDKNDYGTDLAAIKQLAERYLFDSRKKNFSDHAWLNDKVHQAIENALDLGMIRIEYGVHRKTAYLSDSLPDLGYDGPLQTAGVLCIGVGQMSYLECAEVERGKHKTEDLGGLEDFLITCAAISCRSSQRMTNYQPSILTRG